jgi:hypothetical protein
MEPTVYLATMLSIIAVIAACIKPVLQWGWTYVKAVQYQRHSEIPGPPPGHWLIGEILSNIYENVVFETHQSGCLTSNVGHSRKEY